MGRLFRYSEKSYSSYPLKKKARSSGDGGLKQVVRSNLYVYLVLMGQL